MKPHKRIICHYEQSLALLKMRQLSVSFRLDVLLLIVAAQDVLNKSKQGSYIQDRSIQYR